MRETAILHSPDPARRLDLKPGRNRLVRCHCTMRYNRSQNLFSECNNRSDVTKPCACPTHSSDRHNGPTGWAGRTPLRCCESVLVRHELLILNRGRKREPNLRATDRIIAGLSTLFTIGFIHFVSSANANPSCSVLTYPGGGSPPTEHASLRWSHWSEFISQEPKRNARYALVTSLPLSASRYSLCRQEIFPGDRC